MGSAESKLSPPPQQLPSNNHLQSGCAIHALINVIEPLPSDPDDPFYATLFHDYALVHQDSSRLLSNLTTAALNLPSGPHASAVVAVLRAVIHRMRSDDIAALRGALLLANAVMLNLRRAAPDDPVCLVFGAGDAERSLCPADRIDLGKGLVERLVTSALRLLHRPSVASSPNIAISAIDLLLVALGDELYAHPTQSEPFSRLLDRYTSPEEVVASLLDVIYDASSDIDPDALLDIGVEHLKRREQESRKPVNLAVAVSAGAQAFQTGFTEAFSALSSRLPLPSFVTNTGPQNIDSLSQSDVPVRELPVERLRVPDTPTEMNTQSTPETPGLESATPEFDVDTQLIMTVTGNHEDPALLPISQTSNSDLALETPGKGLESPSSRPGAAFSDSMLLAEHALIFLGILCGPRPESPYRKVLCELQNTASTKTGANGYSFSKLYEAMGKWLLHPSAALLAYYLIIGNKRFQTFALARTDPDVFIVPLLASLRRRCHIGVPPADAYIPAVIMLTLTSDKGFCEAIDAISVPLAWLTWVEDKARIGNEKLSMSGFILLVCSRVVQQSLVVRRQEPDCFLASACIGVMANVSGDVTNLHSLAAERLVSLLEFLGRRRKKAILHIEQANGMPMVPPRISDSPRLARREDRKTEDEVGKNVKHGSFLSSSELLERLTEYVGLSLEMIVSILRSRSSVSANRHLVYTLLHREAILENRFVTNGSEQTLALSHMVRRMIGFFEKLVDEWSEESVETGGRSRNQGISVERVFEVIDENARHLRGDLFDGLPEIRFCYEEMTLGVKFLRAYSWSLTQRRLGMACDVDDVIMPLNLSCFRSLT